MPTTMSPFRPRRPPSAPADRPRRLATGLSLLLVLGYGLAVRSPGGRYIDHDRFGETLDRMRGGQGYYRAIRDSFLGLDIQLGAPRSFRQPLPFLLWRWIPTDLLYPAFLLVVVTSTCLLLMRRTEHPIAVLPVAGFLLLAGRNPAALTDPLDGWLLVEFWAIPLLAASSLAWRRGRWSVAAGAATAAALVRELLLPVLVVGLILAHRRGLPRKPWFVGLAVAVGALACHLAIASRFGAAHGDEAPLRGTGDLPRTVVDMLLFNLAGSAVLGLVTWTGGLAHMARRPIEPVSVLVLLPLLGVAVDRPYWALPVAPFVILAAGELVAEQVRRRRSARTSNEASASPPSLGMIELVPAVVLGDT